MKVPRDIDASQLIATLKRTGYVVVRQTGSHIRLSKTLETGDVHHITVPNHKPVKIGTLQGIVTEVCRINNLSVRQFYLALS
ncbi:MAG: type II toxin-antitoxin system HicA family toxin [Defluviitaleaceae bacterium]|nr:type II toxin-antitoxin system HicA family toxin [Defluviitaleaceae bacterium]